MLRATEAALWWGGRAGLFASDCDRRVKDRDEWPRESPGPARRAGLSPGTGRPCRDTPPGGTLGQESSHTYSYT